MPVAATSATNGGHEITGPQCWPCFHGRHWAPCGVGARGYRWWRPVKPPIGLIGSVRFLALFCCDPAGSTAWGRLQQERHTGQISRPGKASSEEGCWPTSSAACSPTIVVVRTPSRSNPMSLRHGSGEHPISAKLVRNSDGYPDAPEFHGRANISLHGEGKDFLLCCFPDRRAERGFGILRRGKFRRETAGCQVQRRAPPLKLRGSKYRSCGVPKQARTREPRGENVTGWGRHFIERVPPAINSRFAPNMPVVDGCRPAS